ncbi:MAG TPA: ubiquinone biosynthesis regulatory protein kinase UbiB, partial [Gammaproteobacteria bacterium]|nr:ubiquinone biosynthesis regulatory protein kinase UbiB [Gammaproteobacteria bacterium]
FRTARQFKMEVQPQLILLQKTLINIEGMGRQIYPDLDLWETAAPFMERWMAKRLGLRSVIRQLVHNSPRWLEQLPEVPDLVLNTFREMKYLTESSRQQERMLIEIQDSLTAQNKKNRSQRLGGLAMLGAILSMLWPASGLATSVDPILSGSILGSLGVYWMYIHS